MTSQLTAVEAPDLEVAWEDPDEGVAYRLTGRMGIHGPEIHTVEIRSTLGAPIATRHIRSPLVSTFVTNFGLTAGEIHQLPIRRGRPKDLQAAANQLDVVARIVRAAPPLGRGRAVAEWFGVTSGYARQLISSAAKAGYDVWR